MKKALWLFVAALVAYGAYDLVREVRAAYTSGYSRVYSHAVGSVMSPGFDSLGLRGRGIRIGVLDAGFGGFRTGRWTRGLRVGACRDFTGGDSTAFFDDPTDHGTTVCANIGGFSGDTLCGLACEAIYFLAKTDCADREPRAEELQMIRGIEWLLEQDVDLISSSLGYTVFDDYDGYTPQMLDGRTSVVSRYIDSLLAARPELIFVQSAGNEGDQSWRHISFPGDVRAVITVGESGFDGRERARSSGVGLAGAAFVKPDFALPASPPGTSFATPVVTGLCAAVLEYRRMNRDSLVALLRASATRADDPDCEVGCGIPQTGRLLELMEQKGWTNR